MNRQGNVAEFHIVMSCVKLRETVHDLTVAIQQTSCVRLCVSLYVCVCICHSVCVYMCVCVSRCLCL